MSKSILSEIFSEIFGDKLGGSQFMMNDIPGIAIDNTDQKKESPFKINILNVGMPMFMWLNSEAFSGKNPGQFRNNAVVLIWLSFSVYPFIVFT
jgi:hypothetical protein